MKRAFRAQIAKYHPDKVQHLGQEFQAMAAERAAELTEAYRILSDAGRRGEYDAARGSDPSSQPAAAPPPNPQPDAAPPQPRAHEPSVPPPPSPQSTAPAPEGDAGPGPQFKHERATRDTFVRKATVDRFRHALDGVGESYDEGTAAGFDLAFLPKSRMFSRSKKPRLLGRFVNAVDAGAIAETWTQAAKWNASNDEVCVFLMASSMAPPRDLAAAIAEQKRKPSKGGKVVLIPMDARNWDAHVPIDAPPICKSLITRLRSGG